MQRGWMDHPMFAKEPYTEREAWAWIIEHTAHETDKVRISQFLVHVERGELAFSRRIMATAWGWHQSRVQRFLIRLQDEGMISMGGDRSGASVLTVTNYNKYQFKRREEAIGQVTGQVVGQVVGQVSEQEIGQVQPSDYRGVSENSEQVTGQVVGQVVERKVGQVIGQGKNNFKKEEKYTPPLPPTGVVPPPPGEKPTKAKTQQGTRLPADWTPSPAEREWCRSTLRWGDNRIDSVAESFRDYWTDKPGKDGRKVRWTGTWKNWCKNEQEWNGRGKHGGHGIGQQDGYTEQHQRVARSLNLEPWAAGEDQLGRP